MPIYTTRQVDEATKADAPKTRAMVARRALARTALSFQILNDVAGLAAIQIKRMAAALEPVNRQRKAKG